MLLFDIDWWASEYKYEFYEERLRPCNISQAETFFLSHPMQAVFLSSYFKIILVFSIFISHTAKNIIAKNLYINRLNHCGMLK